VPQREVRLQSGELGRFEALVLPHLNAAYTLARHLTRDPVEAQDVVQDAYLRALKYFDGFRGADAGAGRAWLLAIVRNTAYTWRRQRRPEASSTEFDERLHSESVADAHPETKLLRTATRDRLTYELEALPPEFRETIILREIQGLSYKEIADVTGVPVGTVMSRLSRARDRLQRALCAEQEGLK
jgi:RNA polymerase sigma factor (sigma-70 family)